MNTRTETKFPWLFLILTFGFTWLVLLPALLAAYGFVALPVPALALVAIAQFGPTLAAFIIAFRHDGNHGIGLLFRRALDWRIPLPWLAVIFILPVVLSIVALFLTVSTGGTLPEPALLAQPLAILPTFLFIFFLQGPVPEEFGWRGYLLDHFQHRYNALASSLVVGVIWAVWHLPLFLMGYLPFPFWAYLIAVASLSILMSWVYNNTGGKLLTALLFHTMFNLSIALFPPMNQQGGDTRGFILLALVYMCTAAAVVLIWGAHSLRRGQHKIAAATK